MTDRRAPRIVLGVTSSQSLKLLEGFPEHLAGRGWEVHVVSSDGATSVCSGVTHHSLNMRREPSPLHDARSMLAWVALLRRLHPDAVVVGTPKAGLLGMVAAFLLRVPVRIYLLHGLRLETETGAKRKVLLTLEKVAARCATVVQAVSPSLRGEAIRHGIADAGHVVVLGSGSSNGVTIREVLPREPVRNSLRVGFVGRLTEDKGVEVLLRAVVRLRREGSAATLRLVGGVESPAYLERLRAIAGPDSAEWMELTGHVHDPTPHYASMDVLCLPTRREGFGNVILEAAVQEVPAIASRVTGCVDAVEDGVSGWLFPVDDVGALAGVLRGIQRDPAQLTSRGQAARQRAIEKFAQDKVWRLTEIFYRRQLRGRDMA